MSIIYDALQKTQQNLANRHNITTQKKSNQRAQWLDICLILIIAFLFIAVAFAYYPLLKKSLSSTTPQPANTVATQGNYVLNGVFLSDQEKVALINNKPFHIGDTIDGLKVVAIELDSIQLKDTKNTFVLRTAS